MAGDLKQFTQYQTAQSIPLAAQNEGGLAGLGAGLASGLAMGQAMTQALTAASMPSIPSMAPTAAAQAPADDPEVRLSKLQGLLQKGLISQTDYDTAKAEILKRLMG
jgi:membrane protease subunit (stomatin/prohibitin family)